MASDEWLAALLGALEGGIGTWQGVKKGQQQERDRKAQQERQARLDANAEEDRKWRIEDRDLKLRDQQRDETDQLLTSIGRDGRVDSALASQARDLNLGHRLTDDVDFTHSYFAPGGPAPVMMVPERFTEVAPTAAERKADQVAAEQKRADEASRVELLDAIKKLPIPLQPVAEFGAASGKMPTLGAADFVSPEERTNQEVARETAKARAMLRIKLREREAEKGIDRKFATMPIPTRDDPSMPQGVRSYLGDLVSRYQSDPAGARAELQRAAPNLLGDHPNLDLVKVTQQMNAMLPMPQLTDEEKEAAAQQRAAQKPITPPITPPSQPPAAAAKVPIPLAGAPKPDARSAQASVLMQQIKQGRAQGQDTTALERQLLALKRGTNAAGVH